MTLWQLNCITWYNIGSKYAMNRLSVARCLVKRDEENNTKAFSLQETIQSLNFNKDQSNQLDTGNPLTSKHQVLWYWRIICIVECNVVVGHEGQLFPGIATDKIANGYWVNALDRPQDLGVAYQISTNLTKMEEWVPQCILFADDIAWIKKSEKSINADTLI